MPTDDEVAYLAEIEAEFAELETEIARISALPQEESPAKVMMLKALRENWQKKVEAAKDQPEWRRKIDAAIGPALEKILEQGLQDAGGGQLGFNLDPETLKTHGAPVLDAVLQGFQGMMADKMKAQAKAAAEARARGEAPPAPNPFGPALQGMMMQLMAGLSKIKMGASSQSAATRDVAADKDAARPDVTASRDDFAKGSVPDEVDAGAASTPAKGEAGDSATPASADEDRVIIDSGSFSVDKKLSTSFDTRLTPKDPAAANEAGKAILQSLFSGLGQLLNTAAVQATQKKGAGSNAAAPKKEAPADAPASPAAKPAQATDEAQAVAAAPDDKEGVGSTRADEGEGRDRADTPRSAPTEGGRGNRAVKVNIDFAGLLGSLLKAAPAKASRTPATKAEPRQSADDEAESPPADEP